MADPLKVYLAEKDGVCAVCTVDIVADDDLIVDIGDVKVHRSCASAEGYELEEGGDENGSKEDDIAAERDEVEEGGQPDDL